MKRSRLTATVMLLVLLACRAGASEFPRVSDAGVPALTGETVFTIPWGDKWGQLKFIAQSQLSEEMFEGPGALLALPGDVVYLYDPRLKRLQKFDATGKLRGGCQLGSDTSGVDMLAPPAHSSNGDDKVILASEQGYYGFIAVLEKVSSPPGPARVSPLLKGMVPKGMRVYRVAATGGGILVEMGGWREPFPCVYQYSGDEYVRRYEMVDLVSAYPWHFGLTLDRGGNKLYNTESGAVLVQRFDVEGYITDYAAIKLPEIENQRERWHLIGVADMPNPPAFFFSKRWPVLADDEIHVASAKGELIGKVKVALPGGKERSRYLKSLNHPVSVTTDALYLGIPDEKGLAIVRYKLPTSTPRG